MGGDEGGGSPIGGKGGGRLEEIVRVETLEEAVEAAARLGRPGDVVLLSPGGTSFDAFQDFAERGDRFKDLVKKL
jgi:UDP-N-acetylmuramoylalanine--D-glutamate ligase